MFSLSNLVTLLAVLGAVSAAPVSSNSTSTTVSSNTTSATSSAAAASSSAAWVVPAGWKRASTPCIAEGTGGRALTYKSYTASDMTIEKCLAYCDNLGMPLAGVEFSTECYCGNVLANGASLSRSGTCDYDCAGSNAEKCGGSGTLSLFVSTVNAGSLSSDLTSTSLTLPSGWTSAGCVQEGTSGRALDGWQYDGIINTATCISYCKSKGYSMAGLEYGSQCFCDNAFRNGGGAPSTSCSMPCSGAPGENCGGPNAIQVYTNPSLAPSSIQGYISKGCIQEVAGRALTGASYQSDSMTVETCLYTCRSQSFTYAALEYGRECYCSNTLSNGASLSKYSNQCTMACSGDKRSKCGGPNALSLYALA